MMEFAESYKHLEVYKYAKHLAKDIFEYSKSFPREETYSLTDQVRRSSRSIGAQIAEAWGKRRYEKHFVSKLTDADGEQLETQHWIEIATTCGYIPNEMSTELTNRCISIGKILNSMISKSAMFCRKPNETNH